MNNKDKDKDTKEYDKKELEEKITTIIEQSKENTILNFISLKIPNLQSIKVKSKIVDILTSILLKEINYNLLLKKIFEEIPDDILSLRPLIWKICLNYLSLKPEEWSDILKTNRTLYEKDKKKYMKNLSSDIIRQKNPLTNKAYYKDKEIYSNINKDVLRTKSNMNFVSLQTKNSETNADVMNRILFIYAKKHQEVCYIQGMNDLLAPIYYCFSIDNNPDNKNFVEHDSYISFEKLMEIIKKIYIRTMDNEPGGVNFRLNEINGLLKITDYELYLHLKRNKIKIEFYGFRWMTLFFTQDFEMPDILRIWDSIFGNNDIFEFLYLLILATIILKKKDIMKEQMSGIMMIIQNLEDITADALINKAVQIRNELSKKYIW
jgi:hypothetical protein